MTTEQEWLGNTPRVTEDANVPEGMALAGDFTPAPMEPTKTATMALEDATALFTEAARLGEAGDSAGALAVGAEAVAMAAAAVDLYYREADQEFEEVLANGGGIVRRQAVPRFPDSVTAPAPRHKRKTRRGKRGRNRGGAPRAASPTEASMSAVWDGDANVLEAEYDRPRTAWEDGGAWS